VLDVFGSTSDEAVEEEADDDAEVLVGTIGTDDGTGIAARLNPTTRSEGVEAPLSWEEEEEDEPDEPDEPDKEDVEGA
jgi:hypothetical protein